MRASSSPAAGEQRPRTQSLTRSLNNVIALTPVAGRRHHCKPSEVLGRGLRVAQAGLHTCSFSRSPPSKLIVSAPIVSPEDCSLCPGEILARPLLYACQRRIVA